MPEQDFVQISNQPGMPGSPTNAQIAADDPSGIGVGPFVQQMSLVNLNATLRNLTQQLSALGAAQDAAGTGRLRVLIDSITAGLTLAAVTTVTNMSQISGFGPLNTLTTAAHYMPFDILTDAWANSVRSRIT
jgi:hypothetical protein